MAGEPILIIDDTAVNLKLTRIVLVNEGYDVRTAPDAEEALAMLDGYLPALILIDIQLPGINGLEFTRIVKANPRTRDIIVVALTACAMTGDEQKALAAGCDGYITKPIDTRTLGTQLRQYLSNSAATPIPASETPGPAPAPSAESVELSRPEMESLRRRFLVDGLALCRQWLDATGGKFDVSATGKTMHQWVGTASLLGYPQISRMAREMEAVLNELPLDNAQLRESLTGLIYAFSEPAEPRPQAIPERISQSLAGKRIALVGFPESDADRMSEALSRVKALPLRFSAAEPPQSLGVGTCNVLIIHVRAETLSTPWLAPGVGLLPQKPLLLIGERETLLGLNASVQHQTRELLMDAWQPEEALMRISLALDRGPADTPKASSPKTQKDCPNVTRSCPQIVLADDDPAVVSIVRAALAAHGMGVWAAADGDRALELVRQQQPDAAVLDVSMPQMNGFALLAAIRSENMPIRIILLTARQQEQDLVRGFALGADDYVIKPFSPMELVVRLKCLLRR